MIRGTKSSSGVTKNRARTILHNVTESMRVFCDAWLIYTHHGPSMMREDLLRESELLLCHDFFKTQAHCLANRHEKIGRREPGIQYGGVSSQNKAWVCWRVSFKVTQFVDLT